jgi:hypothetical protein
MTKPHPLTAQIIARCVKVGPGSPEAKRLYMLRAQLEAAMSPDADAGPEGAKRLAECTARTVREIEQIQRDGGLYVHEHHGAK